MRQNKLKVKKAIIHGWQVVSANIWNYMFYTLAIIVAAVLAGEIPYIGLIIQYAILLAALVAVVRLNDGADFNFNISRFTLRQLLSFLISTAIIFAIFLPFIILLLVLNNVSGGELLYTNIVNMAVYYNPLFGVALTLSFIVGAYLAARLTYYPFAILSHDHGPIQSLRHSWDITRGNVIRILFLGLVSMLLLALGLVGFVIGVLVAYPIIYFAFVDSYKQLIREDESATSEKDAKHDIM